MAADRSRRSPPDPHARVVAARPRRAPRAKVDVPVHQPRAVVARIQRARAARGARRAQPAARAGQVPGHLRRQPRRVLPGPRRRPAPAGRGRQGRPLARRPDRRGTARGRARARPRARRRALGDLRGRPPDARRGGHRARRLRGHPGAPRRAPPALPRRDLPGPDAARGRSGPPVPVHLDAEPVDRGRAARPGDRRARLRAGQGAADPAAPARGRAVALRADRPGHRGQPRHAVHRHGGRGAPPLPGHPQRRPRDRGGRGRRPAARDRGGAPPAPLRRGRPARGRAVDAGRPRARCCCAAWAWPRPTCYEVSGHARPDRAVGDRRARPAGPQARPVVAGHAAAAPAARRRRAGRRLRRDPRRRHPRPPPVRVVRGHDRAVHHPGGRRPRRPDHQADAVPDVGRLAHRPVAHPGRRARQAGRRPGRDQGPLRRGGQHRLGAQARARRGPRRLRAGRAQDALQDGARRPARGLRACAATSTSGPATTTPGPPGSTSTSAC